MPKLIRPPASFTMVNGVETECLLANLSEALASAHAMISDLAFKLSGKPGAGLDSTGPLQPAKSILWRRERSCNTCPPPFVLNDSHL